MVDSYVLNDQQNDLKKIYPAKHVLSSKVEGTPSTQTDGPSPVIPNECEGSKKDFSRSLP